MARAGVVSWLRDRGTHLPSREASGARVRELFPLQWRGRTGFAPVSVAPARHMNCGRKLRRGAAIFNSLGTDQLVHQVRATALIILRPFPGPRAFGGIHMVERGDFAREGFRRGSGQRRWLPAFARMKLEVAGMTSLFGSAPAQHDA